MYTYIYIYILAQTQRYIYAHIQLYIYTSIHTCIHITNVCACLCVLHLEDVSVGCTVSKNTPFSVAEGIVAVVPVLYLIRN